MAMPILPTNYDDPTGQDKRERGAINQFEARFARIGKDMQTLLKSVPVRKLTLSSPFVTNADVVRYEFDVDSFALDMIGQEIDAIVDRWVEATGQPQDQWMVQGYVTPAYQQGTAMAFANLSVQSAAYKSTRESLAAMLQTPEYRRRLGFVQGRAFESMKGLTSYTKERLREALVDGMAQGMNPLAIAENIDKATGMGLSRARTIARTEITTAMRRSRIEEAEQTVLDLGFQVRMMQMSALSATTRLSHARRHGKLFTFEQARVWMATSPNMINCRCSWVEVMVDANGKPLTPGIIARAEQVYKNSGYKEGAE